jgi:type IV secretory pathway TrbD component
MLEQKSMKINIGESDRIFRLAAGLAIIIVGLVAKSWWGILGIPLIITAGLGHCPLYIPFGINTCKFDPK